MCLHKEPLDQEDQDAIILDARAGDLDSLKEIFTTLIDPCMLQTCRDSISKSTALHMACGNGHLETTKYILSLIPKDQLKEYVNLQNETGNTALHWAALNGHQPIVELLCDEFEADPFIKNCFGHDAIFEAENNNKEEVETYFLKKYDVEPASEEEDDNNAGDVQVSKGTEIEDVTKEATEVLSEATKNLNIE
ncbi:Yar1p PWA37_000474 [Arxiozyma heterogenica]|uniref:Uncharacterized protein n=1 Tax=Arxiozyma heterogenica TaxID=278026 RepID=A0AAN7WFB0_9SACH|nr:hypothetical protein RI543_003939 [Kazachstania heterogenica]